MSRRIIGVTVGTSLPKPDWEQTDPKKGDYIKNKPTGGEVLLTDRETGKSYVLFASDGKLMMEESEG